MQVIPPISNNLIESQWNGFFIIRNVMPGKSEFFKYTIFSQRL